MATIDLGKIKQVWRGTYNNGTAYTVDDLVAYTDSNITSTYICVADSTGNTPSSSGTAHASWNYVAKGVVDPVPAQSGNANKFLTTNGSAASWADAGSWTKIASGTGPASGVTTIDFDNIFSAAYKFYKIFITWPQDDYFHYRWIKASDGTKQTGGSYIWTEIYQARNAGAGPTRYGDASQTKGNISYWNSADGQGSIIELTIQDPFNSAEYSTIGFDISQVAAGRLEHQKGCTSYLGAESHRGISLFGAGGDNISSTNFRYLVLGAAI